jgi:hypothetical protein
MDNINVKQIINKLKKRIMYEAIEHYKAYKAENSKIKFNHEQIASINAITYFAVLAIITNCVV